MQNTLPQQSTQFEDPFSAEIWSSTYRLHHENDVDDTFYRVATAIAGAEETPDLQQYWGIKFFNLLHGFKFTTGGRIMANAGNGREGTTLLNCYTSPVPIYDMDSIEGILEVLKYQALTLKSEGGWGMNFSFIRPRGAHIHGVGIDTSGAVRFMEIFDKSSDVVTSGSGLPNSRKDGKVKNRKGAMMGILDVWHPDIEEFVTAKQSEGRLSKFNISVNCSNEFMDRVVQLEDEKKWEKALLEKLEFAKGTPREESAKADLQPQLKEVQLKIAELDKWDLVFPDTQHPLYRNEWKGDLHTWKRKGLPVTHLKTISVMGLWDSILQSTYNRNDPGVLFLDRANESHCWYYGGDESRIVASNPCGEQTMPIGSVCNLASLNLTQYLLAGREGYDGFDLEAIREDVKTAIRFLDNVNTVTNSPLPQYAESTIRRRRVGLGIMGWGSALYLLGVRFGSVEAEELKAELMKVFTHSAVEASIDLAEEKGKFPDCVPELHAKAIFWNRIGLSPEILKRMGEVGIRNSALFSIQPTGNTSIFANVVSGGLEPVFMHGYTRTVIMPHVPPELLPHIPHFFEGQYHETKLFKHVKEGTDDVWIGEFEGTTYKIDRNRGLTKVVLCEDYGVRHLKLLGLWNPEADYAVTTEQLSVDEHLRDLVGWGKWIDASMSKTVNCSNDYSYDKFKDVYLDAYRSKVLKGITTYRSGTMTSVLAAVEEKKSSPEVVEFLGKRPEYVPCDIHHIKVDGEPYFVLIGNVGDMPFEVFAGKNSQADFDPKLKHGLIKRVKRSSYSLMDLDKKPILEQISDHITGEMEALTRMASALLQKGASISDVVYILEKTKGGLHTFCKAQSRILKKYIKDGTKVGEMCPSCGKDELVRREGCRTCAQCGYSACS